MKQNMNVYNYLFLKEKYPFKNKWFNSFVLQLENNNDIDNISMIFEDIIGSLEVIQRDNELIFIYFDDLEFNIKDIVLSISEDFGINIVYFSLPRIYNNENKFLEIYNLFIKYLSNKKQGVFGISDLILEVLKNDFNDTLVIKNNVLGKVLNDPLNESLIIGMFENNLNVLKTSKMIYMHRNTLNNKLEMIKKESGLNIQIFQDAVAMYLLIKIK